MASRNLLHLSHLEPFKQWLTANDVPWRDGRGDYQVMQVWSSFRGKFNWGVVYERHEMPEHFTAQERLVPLVLRFLKSRKEPKP